MLDDSLPTAADFGMSFSDPAFALILIGAALLRLIPVLIVISAVIKLRRYPALRPLHSLLLISTLLVIFLAGVEAFVPALIPTPWRTTGVWSFVWIFAVAWMAVGWTRSAFKTGLRPRGLDIPILVAAAGFVAALFIPIAVAW
ncbi:hypothetical protein [Gymnodinialimonas sp. 57CJ19]|uniref:hypothetical protein n=1 Tax=Gymnodinialimonas sp. 57CJ19 TaxID=3138498 RepID=UPI0031343302